MSSQKSSTDRLFSLHEVKLINPSLADTLATQRSALGVQHAPRSAPTTKQSTFIEREYDECTEAVPMMRFYPFVKRGAHHLAFHLLTEVSGTTRNSDAHKYLEGLSHNYAEHALNPDLKLRPRNLPHRQLIHQAWTKFPPANQDFYPISIMAWELHDRDYVGLVQEDVLNDPKSTNIGTVGIHGMSEDDFKTGMESFGENEKDIETWCHSFDHKTKFDAYWKYGFQLEEAENERIAKAQLDQEESIPYFDLRHMIQEASHLIMGKLYCTEAESSRI